MNRIRVKFKKRNAGRNAKRFVNAGTGRFAGEVVVGMARRKRDRVKNRIRERDHIFTGRTFNSVRADRIKSRNGLPRAMVRIGAPAKPIAARKNVRYGNRKVRPFWWKFLVYGNSRQPARPFFGTGWFPFRFGNNKDFREALAKARENYVKFIRTFK